MKSNSSRHPAPLCATFSPLLLRSRLCPSAWLPALILAIGLAGTPCAETTGDFQLRQLTNRSTDGGGPCSACCGIEHRQPVMHPAGTDFVFASTWNRGASPLNGDRNLELFRFNLGDDSIEQLADTQDGFTLPFDYVASSNPLLRILSVSSASSAEDPSSLWDNPDRNLELLSHHVLPSPAPFGLLTWEHVQQTDTAGPLSVTGRTLDVQTGFDSTTLPPSLVWSEPEPGPDYNLAAAPGKLRLIVPSFTAYNCWTPTGDADRMPRLSYDGSLPGDWSMEAKVSLSDYVPGAGFHAGLCARLGDDDYLTYGFYSGQSLAAQRTGTGLTGTPVSIEPVSTELRIVRTGTTFTFWYRLEGETDWTKTAQFDGITETPDSAGLFARTWEATNLVLDFDNLTLQSCPFPWFDSADWPVLANIHPDASRNGLIAVWASNRNIPGIQAPTGRNSDLNYEIFRMNLASGEPLQITSTGGGDSECIAAGANLWPRVDATGNRIVFVSNRALDGPAIPAGRHGIFLWTAPGAVQRLSSANIQVEREFPAFGMDDAGTLAVFASDANPTGENPDLNREIFGVHLSTQQVFQITNTSTGVSNSRPILSGDGAKMAFLSNADFHGTNPDGSEELWIYHFDADNRFAAPFLQVTGLAATPSARGNRSHWMDGYSFDRTGSKLVLCSCADLVGQNTSNAYELFLASLPWEPVSQDIAVEVPAGSEVSEGGGIGFPRTLLGHASTLTVTLRNNGHLDLTGLAVSIDGLHAAEFTAGSPGATTLAPGASTTFDLTFTPASALPRHAALHIASNDPDENPFLVTLRGLGATDHELASSGAIAIPDSGAGSPNPSILTVSGITGTALSLRVKLQGVSHTNPDDLDVFLMAPNGSVFPLMSDAGGSLDVVNVNLVLDDAATLAPPDDSAFGSGTYLPANYGTPAEALPPGGTGWAASLAALASGDVNGDWKLFVSDDTSSHSGSINSWSLQFLRTDAALPQIAVEQPAGNALEDGVSGRSFGDCVLGNTATMTFVIRNDGTTDLWDLALSKDGAQSAEFALGGLGATTLAPGASTAFDVTFTPAGFGTRTATLRLSSSDANESPFDVTLTGNGVAPDNPEIAVEQPEGTHLTGGFANIGFGSVTLGGTPSACTFTIRNLGAPALTGLAVTVEGAHAADFGAGPLGETTLATGASTTFTVAFAPGAAGLRTAQIHIASNDEDENPFTVSLYGTGVEVPVPEIAIEQPAGFDIAMRGGRDFGIVNLGSGSSMTFTIRNTGTAGLTGLTIDTDGTNADEFAITKSPSPTVAPGGTTTFTIRFSPLDLGDRSADIHVTSNDADENPFTVSLFGKGTGSSIKAAINSPVPGATLTSGTVTFSWTSGSGASAYWLQVGTLPGDFAYYDSGQVSTGVRSKTVSGLPTNGRTIYARLWTRVSGTWLHNDYSYTAFTLIAPEIAVEQPSKNNVPDGGTRDFGPAKAGTSASLTFTIRNTGNANLTGLTIAKNGSHAADFAVTSAPAAPVLPNEDTTFTVTFTPGGGGTRSAVLHIASNDADENPFDILLTGTGVLAPEIAVEHPAGTSLDTAGSPIPFGTVATGFQSAAKTFQIRNTGSANLTLSLPTVTGSGTAHFALSTKGTATVLKPRATTRFTVAFSPTAEGVKFATLAIASNDDDKDPFEVPLWGTAIPPDFQFAVSQGIAGEDLPSDITGLGTVLSVSGLPSGMKYDASTGTLTGTPAKAGAYTVKVRVRGLDGTVSTVEMTIYVEALPAWAVGTFTALISPPEDPASQPLTGLGGYLRLTSSVSGTCTGSLILGAKKLSFKGQIEGVPEEDREEEGLSTTVTIVPNSKDRSQDITLDLDFRPEDAAEDPGLTGTLTFLGVPLPIGPGWQHLWSSKTNPAFGNKDRVLNVALDNTEASEGPQGDSLAILKLTKAGLATWSGTLADGRKVTGSFTASPDGDLPFYAAIPYPGGGALIALLGTEPVDELLGVVDEDDPNGRWIKRAPLVEPKTLDRSYATGFDLDLDIAGAQFAAPPKGQLLFGNPIAPLDLSMELRGAGIDSSTQLPGVDPVVLAAELQAGNKLVVTQSDLPPKFTLAPKLSASSGQLTLSAKLSDLGPGTIKPVARTLTFTALYIPDLLNPQNSAIRGFFLLPALPEVGQSAAAPAIPSGMFKIHR